MHPVTCPHCRAPLSLPPDLPPGQRCRCPACKEAFDYPGPVLPVATAVPEEAPPRRRRGVPWNWVVCLGLTMILALVQLVNVTSGGPGLREAVVSAGVAAWVVVLYVLARCWDEIRWKQ